ncbi:MAG: threonine aldolase family protein [Gemmobacter sp.]
MFFASDNGAPVPPQVMAALAAANAGPAMPYGADPWTERAVAAVRTAFEAPQAEVFLVATGTAANALSLAALCPPWGAIFCQPEAHTMQDECGAPEFFSGGAKLVPVAAEGGRMGPRALRDALARLWHGSVHSVQRGALSITNVTEAGTVYDPDQIAALAEIAHSAGMPVHLDGARIANALAASGASPAEMTWKAGVDVLSLGGTKTGLMAAEAVVIFNRVDPWEMQLRRKRAGHLFSKHRYLGAQIDAWLADGLWLDLARHSNAMAARLASGIAALPGARLWHPVEANIVFADLPRDGHDRAVAAGARYYPFGEATAPAPQGARLVTSWATDRKEVDRFLACLSG